jgi:hypothetical protein
VGLSLVCICSQKHGFSLKIDLAESLFFTRLHIFVINSLFLAWDEQIA